MPNSPIPPAERVKKRAIVFSALLEGKTVTESARLAGIHPATAQKWMDDPEFAQELIESGQRIKKLNRARVTNLLSKTTDKLIKLLDSPSETIQLKAIHEVHDLVVKNPHTDSEQQEELMAQLRAWQRAASRLPEAAKAQLMKELSWELHELKLAESVRKTVTTVAIDGDIVEDGDGEAEE